MLLFLKLLFPQIKSFGAIRFYDHMMQWANQMTGWVTTRSRRKSIISRPADDGMAARNPLGKGKGTWFCVSVRVCVCARACRHTCLSLLYLHNSSYFAAHSCTDCLGTESGGGADCWDAWRWCLHAVALSSVTLTDSRWGLIKYCAHLKWNELHIGTICTWLWKPLPNTIIFLMTNYCCLIH